MDPKRLDPLLEAEFLLDELVSWSKFLMCVPEDNANGSIARIIARTMRYITNQIKNYLKEHRKELLSQYPKRCEERLIEVQHNKPSNN